MRVTKETEVALVKAVADGRATEGASVKFHDRSNLDRCYVGLTTLWTITIPNYTPPLLNKLLAMHWAKRGREKRICADLVKAYAVQAGVPPAKCRRHVEFYFTGWARKHGGGNLPDSDALDKVMRDALVTAGLIVDDSDKWAEFEEPVIVRGPKQTTIRLYDVPQGATE